MTAIGSRTWPALKGQRKPARIPYWLYRLCQAVPIILLIVTVNFFLLRLAPGDAADVIAAESGTYSFEYTESLRKRFGLDQPLFLQYLDYLWQIFRFELGWSHRNNQSVASLIGDRLPATVLLVVTAIAVAAVLGTLLGAIAALTSSKLLDTAISSLATLGFATPLFWLGLLLIVLFSVHLQWLPSGGVYDLGTPHTGWSALRDRLAHLVLPACCLATYYMSIYARIMRMEIIEIKHQDFVRTAKAKGASASRIALRHIFPNALLGLVTLTGLQFGAVFSGSITIEAVFGWPGLGQLALNAVAARDYNLLLGILLVSSLLILAINLITDLSYNLLDPRLDGAP